MKKSVKKKKTKKKKKLTAVLEKVESIKKKLNTRYNLLRKKKDIVGIKLFPLRRAFAVVIVMLFFALLIFFSEFLPFNEEVVVISCIFLAFLCIDIFAAHNFKQYLLEYINDNIKLADKNMEEVKAILAVKGSQEVKCNYSLLRKKIFVYGLFFKLINVDDVFNEVMSNNN